MFIHFCKSKIAHATITQAELHYEGSITIDANILKAANIIEGERVEVLNMNNGSRIETYAIVGKAGSGVICLNGPAARTGLVGDQVVILCYGLLDAKEAQTAKLKLVKLNAHNKIVKS